ncbi:TIGR03086 family metal-binding protein [Streptomyces sp. H39-C1]|uniref:TIGR03086 family metal-binding protein n=1 Tax=Streptomyces sp. H39-C1 TaxID=3004355 RepID=UPI0022AFD77B|nr:TIGR03086 family metal-binding protein [Streptomyces sp. H39-C1]MCZ4095165.1 TIGR03086 family metal-binding protein [Streptomyces sp. H39-C1]
MTSVDGFKLLAEAHSYLRTDVLGVPEDAWGNPTPCAEWTVRQVLNHARLDQQALVMQIAEVGPPADPFEPEDALGADPVGQLDEVLAAATAAWVSVGRDAENVPTPFGPIPAWQGTGTAALDAAVHAWDIAKATGQDLPLTADLAEGLQVIADLIVDFIRDNFHKFGPALPAPEGATAAQKLLAFTGRDPEWAPAV